MGNIKNKKSNRNNHRHCYIKKETNTKIQATKTTHTTRSQEGLQNYQPGQTSAIH